MEQQALPEDTKQTSEEVLLYSSTTQEQSEVKTSNPEDTTTMQTTNVVESNENGGDIIAIVKPSPSTGSVPPAQTEEEDNMNDIPGIRVSMATIVELPPLEVQQQRLSDESVPPVSEKVIDEIFSSIITLPEELQQVQPSEPPNQLAIEQTLQVTEVTETIVTNETSEEPIAINVTNETDVKNEIDEITVVETVENASTGETTMTTDQIVIVENTEQQPVENITEIVNEPNEGVQNNVQIVQSSSTAQDMQAVQVVQDVQNSQSSPIIHDVQSNPIVQDNQNVRNDQNVPIVQGIPPTVHDVQSVQDVQNVQSSEIVQNEQSVQNIQISQNVPILQNEQNFHKVPDVQSVPFVQDVQNVQNDPNVQNAQVFQGMQSAQHPMIIDQDNSQLPELQKTEQATNETDQVSPEVASSMEVLTQQLQQSSIPLVQSVSDATTEVTIVAPTGDDVQQMETSAAANVNAFDYEDAIKKAHAIAAKLLNNEGVAVVQNPQNIATSNAQQGVKRLHEDSYNPHVPTKDNRDDYRDDYRRDSYPRRDRGRYDDYGRDSKRAAYDDDGGGRHRYGLGSEERRPHHGSHYGPGEPRGTGHEEFKVPNAVVGLVIGRGGENLKRIEKTTGARIQFSQDQPPDVVERRVTITGQPDDVKTARSMIQQLVEDASNGTLTSRRDSHSGGNRTTITIHIPVNKVGVVIGRGGETIRDLQDRSGARINVTPDSAASPQSNDRPVTLIGDETAVQRAKALIDEIVNTGESSSDRNHPKDYRSNNYGNNYNNTDNNHHGNGYSGGHYGSNHGQYNHHSGKSSQDSITIQVPNDSVGLIIGKGGETVRALQQQSGAKIQIEPVHGVPPVDRNVQIIGTAENIAIAKSLILEKAASGNRERQSRHNNDQGRNDYGSSGYQQSGYQQSGYQQSGYQQSGYQQGSYQQSSYPQSSYSPSSGYQQGGVSSANVTSNNTNYQQTGYPTNTYSTNTPQQQQQQQTAYGQSTSNDYGQSTASGYPSANTYGVAGQQPQTAYSQYGQYGTAQAATPYSQYPTQTQYGAYGQTTQYSQSTPGQPVGQPTIQPVIQPVIQAVNNQPTGQPSVQSQVGYYSAQTTTMDPNKIGSGNEIKSDVQAVSATPNYAYQQYGYNYGTPTSNQYPTVATGQIQTAAVSQAAGGYPLLGATATAYGTPTAINTGTTSNSATPGSDQTNLQTAYSGYYGQQQYTQDQYNQQQNYYQYFQQQQQQQQPPAAYNYQTTPANLPTEAPKQ